MIIQKQIDFSCVERRSLEVYYPGLGIYLKQLYHSLVYIIITVAINTFGEHHIQSFTGGKIVKGLKSVYTLPHLLDKHQQC